MLERMDDTIVAVSSAPGNAPVGVVRLSGPNALLIASQLCPSQEGKLTNVRGHRRLQAEVCPAPQVRLPAVLYLFRAPHSYTRQDLVEIHTVGSLPVLDWIRQAAMSRGAVAARPGEFTARAFLNGAMNLAEAEGVAAVIRAQTDLQLRASRRMIEGALHQRVEAARDALAELLALVEADIDFAEEPIEFITPADLRQRLGVIASQLDELLTGGPTREQLDALPRILLLGAPNAGKSSLMNALTGIPRALCAPVPGTTRDILSAPLRLGRGEAVLLDAAGVDESSDEVIAQARTMALATAQRVDLVCLVVDVTRIGDDRVLAAAATLNLPYVVVAANKCDLIPPETLPSMIEHLVGMKLGHVCAVSALQHTGLDDLHRAFLDGIGRTPGSVLSEAILLSERQQSTIRDARDALQRAADIAASAAETIDCADILAFELREALDALAAVTGAVTTEDLLARVFANFCIGK